MHNMSSARADYLKTKEGKLVAVWNHNLEVRDFQVANIHTVGLTVQRWTAADNSEQLAFSCMCNSTCYYPKVDGGTLQLERKQTDTQGVIGLKPDNSYLFEWKDSFGGGAWRGLQTVVEPKKHLFISDRKVVLSSDKEKFVLFQLTRGQ